MKKRSVLTVLVATLLVAAMTMTANAQRGGGQRGGQRGQGGFGGGMMMGRGGFGGGSLLQLARNEAVQKEIETTDGQVEKINTLSEELRPRREEGAERPNFREMEEEERNEYFAKMRKEFEERAKEGDVKLGKILLPHQMKRLKQIRVQQMGNRALVDPEVAAALKITAAQKTKMEKLATEAQEKIRALFTRDREEGERPSREDMMARMTEMREKMTEMRDKAEKEVMAVLSADQKKKFEELKGEPFEMPRPQFGRGGQRGGGQRGGDQGGGRPQRPGF